MAKRTGFYGDLKDPSLKIRRDDFGKLPDSVRSQTPNPGS